MTEAILIEHHSGWTEIALNRPDRLNALNDPMHFALRAAMTAAGGDTLCRGVFIEKREPVLTGRKP